MLSAADVTTECVYRSIACNRGTGTADIHSTTDSILHGGGQSAIVLSRSGWRYSVSQYLPLSSPVTATTWVKLEASEIAVVGCEKGGVTLWNVGSNTSLHVCKHTQSVVYVTAISFKGTVYIVSQGSDSLVHIHTFCSGELETYGTITVARDGFALSGHVFSLHDALLLALGTDDSNISLYHLDDTSPVLLTTLSGHEDWVRGLDFAATPSGGLLASSSQDHYIRLWNLARDEDGGGSQFKLKEKILEVQGTKYRVTVESILLGHDNWVTSVRWMSNGMLLSSSMDKTLIIWHQGSDGLWSENVHVGEVGGNNLGLFGSLPTSDSSLIISHSFQGAFQAWRESSDEGWVGVPMPGGHFSSVKDLSWAPSGNYLISGSLDQSVRVSAEWRSVGWYEVARSQIHGHDMSCLDCISENQYLSGSEEKVLRVFQATSTFFSNLMAITGCKVNTDMSDGNMIGALIPALGLSNKAITPEDMKNNVVHGGTATIKDCDVPYQVAFAPAALNTPPVEELLLQNTLWPEVHKLYGHGYEVYQCAASPDGNILATSCKASKQQFAAVILWRVGTWTKITELSHHNLTVTRMKFSPDSSKLLSVSRDRDWAVWDVSSFHTEIPTNPPTLVSEDQIPTNPPTPISTSPPKAHSRIIWDCAWYPESDSFVTVARDKKLVVWDRQENAESVWTVGCSRTFNNSITAVDVSIDGLILLGFETGDLSICCRSAHKEVVLLCELPRTQCATLTINTVQWRPSQEDHQGDTRLEDGQKSKVFAACSDDGALLLVSVHFPEKRNED